MNQSKLQLQLQLIILFMNVSNLPYPKDYKEYQQDERVLRWVVAVNLVLPKPIKEYEAYHDEHLPGFDYLLMNYLDNSNSGYMEHGTSQGKLNF